MIRRHFLLASLGTVALTRFLQAADAPAAEDLKAVIAKGYDFLKTKQGADGGFLVKTGPGVTAMIAASLAKAGYGPEDPVVKKALEYMAKYVKEDGGVYDQGLENYTTSLAIVTFKEVNKDGKYDKVIANALKYVRGIQDATGADEKNANFGGSGYNAKSRPDTSNTAFFVEALIAGGAGKDDPAVKKALVFLSRSQNLPGEFNNQPFAKKADKENEGGFVYNLSDQTNDKSEKKLPNGGLRSEGGMTYAGLKSFLYAGVDKKDKRVVAAIGWVKKHYTLTENPGMGQSGLYYYYHTFSKAMDAYGEEVFEDAKGVKHPWKQELFDTLKKAQKADGSWVNANGAFLENAPELATAFAILSLTYTKGK